MQPVLREKRPEFMANPALFLLFFLSVEIV
jgi:hypothetical protein